MPILDQWPAEKQQKTQINLSEREVQMVRSFVGGGVAMRAEWHAR